MLDVNIIRENPKLIKENLKNRGLSVDVDRFLELDAKRSELIGKIDSLRSVKNKFKEKPNKEELGKLKSDKEKEEKLSVELEKIEKEYYDLLGRIPNLTHRDVVVSDDEHDNPVLEEGKPPKFGFEPQDHVTLAEKLDLIDFERAAKVSGAKFYYLKNELALMEFALIQYALEICTKHGFTPFSTPDLAKKDVLEGLGYNPRGESTQIYNIEETDLSLIGTAEITMGGYHMNETLEEEDLPKKYVAVSHCFRTEAGTYSKFSKGIFRIHQFTKVEMFEYTTPETSEKAHQEILSIEKEIYKGLDIPFRVIDHATCDLGSPASRTFDLEAWMPGKPNEKGGSGDWAEITSTSNCTDYQSRGLNIKYKDNSGKKEYVHMLNGTAIAVARTLIAIMENYQTKDGSIEVPKVLQKWVGKKLIAIKQ
jgi:seryl-tRNA synthetase